MKYIENEEEEEYETNQQHVGMKELFRGYVVKDWKGTNLSAIKYETMNKIIARKHVEFHMKHWKREITNTMMKRNNVKGH